MYKSDNLNLCFRDAINHSEVHMHDAFARSGNPTGKVHIRTQENAFCGGIKLLIQFNGRMRICFRDIVENMLAIFQSVWFPYLFDRYPLLVPPFQQCLFAGGKLSFNVFMRDGGTRIIQ